MMQIIPLNSLTLVKSFREDYAKPKTRKTTSALKTSTAPKKPTTAKPSAKPAATPSSKSTLKPKTSKPSTPANSKFDETKHPRANDGEFTKKGAGASAQTDKDKRSQSGVAVKPAGGTRTTASGGGTKTASPVKRKGASEVAKPKGAVKDAGTSTAKGKRLGNVPKASEGAKEPAKAKPRAGKEEAKADAGKGGKKEPALVVDPKAKRKPKGAVADVRTEGQTNHQLAYDVGAEVFGSRKDLAALREQFSENIAKGKSVRGILANLESIDPGAAKKYCTKDNILQKFDWEAQRRQGVDLQAAMMKKLVFDRIQPKPEKDDPDTRRQYAYAIEELHRLITPVKTVDDLKGLRRSLSDRMRLETAAHLVDQQRYLAYSQKEAAKEPTQWDLKGVDRTYNKDGSVTRSDITAKEWKKRELAKVQKNEAVIAQWHENAKNPYHVLGDKLTAFFTDNESYNRTADTISKKNPKWEDYLSPQQREAKPKTNRKAMWQRQIDNPNARVGGRAGKVQKPEDAVKQFGLRGVQFGHWVDDTSGKFHLLKASEALQDMADTLGMKDKDVSLNGRLALAFGARGIAGMGAAAHYEPDLRVINLTKEGGAGSLAHEWAHAVDDIIGDHSGIAEYASENADKVQNPEVRKAYTELMDAIEKGDGSHQGTTKVENQKKTFSRYYPSERQAVKERGLTPDLIKEHADKINREFDSEKKRMQDHVDYGGHYAEKAKKTMKTLESRRKRALNDKYQELMAHHFRNTGEHVTHLDVPTSGSEYLNRMKELDGDRSKPYFSTGREMFARVFESWMEHTLKEKGAKNHYLVAGTSEKMVQATEAPFPAGSERTHMFDKMGRLMKAIVGTGEIKKALEADLQKGHLTSIGTFAQLWAESVAKSGETKRYAYQISHTVDPSEVLYIPVNRLVTIYQTDAASSWDKVKENMNHMQAGEALEPIVIGYDYDIHDGHHRYQAAMALDHTHVPCIVGGTNELQKTEAMERYRELWKAVELEGGAWRTMNGHHVYVKGGEIVAGGQSWMHGKSSSEVSAAHKDTKEGAGNDGYDAAVEARDVKLQKPAKRTALDDDIDRHNDKLKKLAQKYTSAEDFDNAVRPGMGAKSVSDVYGIMDKNSEGHLNSSAIKGALSDAGKYFFLTRVDPSKLNTKGKYHEDDEDKISGVKDEFDQSKAPPVIVGKDGEVIDGRHRTLSAKKSGVKEIHAYVSAKDFYNQHVKGNLQKSIVTDPTNEPGSGGLPDDPNTMYRGIGQKELDAIYASGFVQTKGKGNDGDKGKRTTCFTNLYTQAEGYARSQYSLYGEKAAYVIALPKPPWVYEDEYGELLSDQPVPFAIGVIIPIADPDAERGTVFSDGEVLA